METIITLLFFLYGLIFGSFFNVVGLRVPNGSLFCKHRSYCDTCQRTLRWIELLPVLSFVLQKGKCRGCKQKISPLYPLMEMLTGMLFGLSYLQWGFDHTLILSLLLISLIIPVTVSDLAYKRIPNKILLFFAPLFLIYRLFYPLSSFWLSLFGAILAFGLIASVIFLSKGGMGMGDLKYFVLFGFIFGPGQFLLLFFLSTLYGAFGGLVTMRVKKISRRSQIAFGPYIGLAALSVFFFGDQLISWYVSFF
ncbi:Leader peptidase (Prepilin peptidase) [Alkalibacterium sp. AK22]|uniref:prepilin peptidase n=1 Tax=Alkalibacterium sp. AK22 TaxID=1229520 RepID=UPI00044EFEF8|nr:A24 family peptidase [Alkalibacterium sp. AK22]EXJ22416.1 Leader peptidase (Prepilin peptidase) [Alkalibacterium sp. AK22]